MEGFAKLLRTIVRPVVTLLMVGASTVMILNATEIPEWYTHAVVSLVGFWFGSRGSGSDGNQGPRPPEG